MTDLFSILTAEDYEKLDKFLLDRANEDEYTEDMEEGVLDISELDGFFTAIVSGPVMIPPSQWLPAVWGDVEPEWDDEKEFEDIFSIMIRHMNCIVDILMEQSEDFEPIFLESEVDGKTCFIVDEWCEGYCRGMALAADRWMEGGQAMALLVGPIVAFTDAENWRGRHLGGEEMEKLQNAIAPNAREIHAFWISQRDENTPLSQPLRRTEPRVGRNAPCPCGSGKKYKKCCLH